MKKVFVHLLDKDASLTEVGPRLPLFSHFSAQKLFYEAYL